MALSSYYLQNWSALLLYSSAPYFLVIVLLWFLPESIAWEFGNIKNEKLQKKILRIYKVNNGGKNYKNGIQILVPAQTNEDKSKFMLLWKPLAMAVQTLCLALAWVLFSVSYIGMSYAATNLTGNIHRDFALLNGSEMVACFVAIFFSKRYGRKLTIITSMVLAGLCLVVVASLPTSSTENNSYKYSRLVFGVCGKLLTTVVADTIYSWTAETYPTFLRSSASGFHQSCSTFGHMIAPWVGIWLNRYHSSIPYFSMAALLLIAACLLIKIEETSGKKLPEKIENIYNLEDVPREMTVSDYKQG